MDELKVVGIAALVLASVATYGMIGTEHNVPEIKEKAPYVFDDAGLEIEGYEGYKRGGFSTFGGCVYYTVKRKPDNGRLYSACISKWGKEYHIYDLRSVDFPKVQVEN